MRWEYKTAIHSASPGNFLDDGQLNKLGRNRWELVSIHNDTRGIVYHFKRELILLEDL